MSFHNNQYKRQNKIEMHRKEKDSFFTHHFVEISHTLSERASAFTSKGSITLEAALSSVFFFFAMLCVVYLFEIMAIQTSMKSALHAVAKEIAVESYVNPVMISATKLEQRIAKTIGENRLENSFVVNGCNGLDCSQSKQYWDTTIMDLQVNYQIELPIAMFRIPVISKEEIVRVKGWTGHEMKTVGSENETMVYVTDYGIVYHMDMNCSFLELSLKMVDKKEVEHLRNENGGKYKECTACKGNSNDHSRVYITDYGNRYHTSLECSGIKRTVYEIPLSDARGLGGCSKCVK